MSLITLFNLVCPHGHHYFAPDPDYWVGRECGKPAEQDQPRSKVICRAPLKPYRAGS